MLPEEHLDNIENGNEGDGDVYESSLRRDEKMKPLPLKDAIFWFYSNQYMAITKTEIWWDKSCLN